MSILDAIKDLWPGEKNSDGEFRASLTVNNQKFETRGETAFDAFQAFELNNFLPKTKAILRVEHGDNFYEKVIYPMQLRRFINNRVTREVIAKGMQTAVR